ncbi:hypothetical protein F1C16_01845 [Hymenobacter sp. NBH84]|uniref:Outer membrane beta-barrel protein n=1 Tax=Hymenobacter defluvii TaxID=2054411 RepID=A0ABS3THP5_9BACT|nr:MULTISPECIES: hypothetical protein [Hymenobacter]MBO3273182.1 hypothetical protein [Hymenobacter defluvii]QNE38390.1 hypothetical protein F1C16_01845 [Hymenobacter sp. NBH84]
MHTPFRRIFSWVAVAALLAATSCVAPRTIVSTGKVTPRGEFRVGGNAAFNVPTATLGKAGSALKSAAESAARADTVRYSQTVTDLQAAALAYVLDPVQPTADLYLRYGVLDRLDVGYKYAFGSHVFDAMYQFLGPVGSVEHPQGRGGDTYASIGLQYATQRAKLPNFAFLDNITDAVGFRASRHDLLVPLVFSKSFGPEEEKGAFSYGVVYAHTFLSYRFQPGNIFYQGTNQRIPDLPLSKQNFSSFGAFANVKIGYRYAYIIPSLSIFYQNYGTFALLNNASTSLKGLTIVPSLGLQFRVPTR